MSIKLIKHWNLFQLQSSLIPRGSTNSLKMRGSLGVGTDSYGRKQLVIGPHEPWKAYGRGPSPVRPSEPSHTTDSSLWICSFLRVWAPIAALKIYKCKKKSTLQSWQKPLCTSLKYYSYMATLSPQVFNPKTIYWTLPWRAIFLFQPISKSLEWDLRDTEPVFSLSPTDLTHLWRRFPEPISAKSGEQAESANASSRRTGPGDKCPQH